MSKEDEELTRKELLELINQMRILFENKVLTQKILTDYSNKSNNSKHKKINNEYDRCGNE